jgi:hypothetical protein
MTEGDALVYAYLLDGKGGGEVAKCIKAFVFASTKSRIREPSSKKSGLSEVFGLRNFSSLCPFALLKLPLRIKTPELRRVHAVFK